MKKRLVLVGLFILIILAALAFYLTSSRNDLIRRQSAYVPLDMPAALICLENPGNDSAWHNWPQSTTSSGILRNGLVSDDDLLWISADRGVARLNVRTWRCEMFTQGAGRSLAGAFPVLPDGEGGAWVGVGGGVLRFRDGRWRLAYDVPDDRPPQVAALGFGRSGAPCLQLQSGGRRSFAYHQTCLAGQTFPLENTPFVVDYGQDQTEQCDRWQRMSGQRYNYEGSPACRLIQHVQSVYDGPVVSSPSGDEIWMVENAHQENARLFHWRGDTVEDETTPYRDVHALARDPVHGGVWMATEEGLAHVQDDVGENGRGSNTTFLLFSRSAPPPADRAGATEFDYRHLPFNVQRSPGRVRSMVVDQAGRVWAAGAGEILRYDEADHVWHPMHTSRRPSILAADPVQGVWGAAPEVLIHLIGERKDTWPISDDYRDEPTALLATASRHLWLGTLKRGVLVAPLPEPASNEPIAWRRFTITDGLASEWITGLAQGGDGRVYAAHYAGVSVFTLGDDLADGRWTTLAGSNAPVEGMWANSLATDSAHRPDRLWVGYHHTHQAQLRHYRGDAWTNYQLGDAWGVGALLVDDRGLLWAGTTHGLWRQLAVEGDEPRWEKMAWPDMIVRDVWALAQDKEGRIWVGGREGIAMWAGDEP